MLPTLRRLAMVGFVALLPFSAQAITGFSDAGAMARRLGVIEIRG